MHLGIYTLAPPTPVPKHGYPGGKNSQKSPRS